MTNDSSRPFIVIFTDLDGTLLDHETYGWEEAKPALNLCKSYRIPVILTSSKTRAEMNALIIDLGLSSPFISENGGGIFFPKEIGEKTPDGTKFAHGLWQLSLGTPYQSLVEDLREIRDELGWPIRGFSEMPPEEISRFTGLNLAESRLAGQREYDEPFVLLNDKGDRDSAPLHEAAKRRGLTITEGGRFYHLKGTFDKGEAVDKLIAWYRGFHADLLTIALGDSPNDFGMLKRVDCPVLIRSARVFPGLERDIPGLVVTKEKGPKGWNAAVLDIFKNKLNGRNS